MMWPTDFAKRKVYKGFETPYTPNVGLTRDEVGLHYIEISKVRICIHNKG
jgi:hypothetical protein